MRISFAMTASGRCHHGPASVVKGRIPNATLWIANALWFTLPAIVGQINMAFGGIAKRLAIAMKLIEKIRAERDDQKSSRSSGPILALVTQEAGSLVGPPAFYFQWPALPLTFA
ncbi:MAG: hypothetical protein ACREE3_14420, partial [Stellaceae bacterium]